MALLPANLHFHVSHPCAAEVYKQTFWMRQWGHETAKRTVLFSNSKWVGGFNLGKMSRAMLESKVKPRLNINPVMARPGLKGIPT